MNNTKKYKEDLAGVSRMVDGLNTDSTFEEGLCVMDEALRVIKSGLPPEQLAELERHSHEVGQPMGQTFGAEVVRVREAYGAEAAARVAATLLEDMFRDLGWSEEDIARIWKKPPH